MALGALPPWISVQPQDFVRAGQEGADAGLSAARIEQAGRLHAEQLGMEAQRMKQKAAAEAARLSQAEHIAEMETQARQEIAQQNRLREDQQNLIQNAQRQAEFGLHRSRLEQQDALAQAKDREAAMSFAQTAGLAAYLKANHGDMAGALMQFPHARQIVSALKAPKPPDEIGAVESQDIEGGRILSRKGSKDYKFIPNEKPKTFHESKTGEVFRVNPDGTQEIIRSPRKTAAEQFLESHGGETNAPASANPSPFKEGQKVRHKDGSIWIIKGGVPVPVADNTTSDETDNEV